MSLLIELQCTVISIESPQQNVLTLPP